VAIDLPKHFAAIYEADTSTRCLIKPAKDCVQALDL
jgi:hypothetical protein